MKARLTPFAKLLIVAAVVGGTVFAVYKLGLVDFSKTKNNNGNSGDNSSSQVTEVDGNAKQVSVGVVTWGGYVGGQYFNEGFKANNNSRYYKDYGFLVDFKVLDDFNASRDAWKSDQVQLLWATIDAFTTEVAGLKEFDPVVLFQSDWSRGGDAIVVRRGINSVADLRGKTIAFAEMTPSHTFLLWMLEAGDLKYSDIQPKVVESAIDAADLFKKGQVDAAVVWSPDDADCISKVTGSKILQNTKNASNIIADVFIVKRAWLDQNRDIAQKLVEGWMKGAAEINTSTQAKDKAAKILADGLGQPEDFCRQAIDNVRLCTYGDNLAFFGQSSALVTGEEIYNKMEQKYGAIGYVKDKIPSWRTITDVTVLKAINLSGPGHEAEGAKTFTEVTEQVAKAEAISNKSVTITFASGVSTLDDNMKYIIDSQFLDIAKSFANARIRIEGNTDNVGDRQSNVQLSKMRAQAVADYLINEHKFDRNRFIVVGNGPDKPVDNNNTDDGRKRNRRTDFQLVAE